MAGNLSTLVVVLLGAGCATTGLLLIISNRNLRRLPTRTNRLETQLLPALLLLLGTGLALMGWLIAPDRQSPPPDINSLINSAPTASGPPLDATIKAGSVLLLVWGTPNDMDKAGEQAEQAYSYTVGKALASRLAKANPGLRVENLLLTRQQQRQALFSPDSTRIWCAEKQWEVLALLDIGATRHSEQGYVPWREPIYIFRDCIRDRYRQVQGRVSERPGDAFPYQQALEREFLQELNRFSRDRQG